FLWFAPAAIMAMPTDVFGVDLDAETLELLMMKLRLCRAPRADGVVLSGRGAVQPDAIGGEQVGSVHSSHSPSSRSSAAPSGPLARPWLSRHRAQRIASGSAPCWTAKLNTIAESRAFVSAALLLLWLLRNSSRIRPSGNRLTVAV